ncbi:LINE-1 retrotransposable element ORF2 protein [Elysia marginata]|uniref:LINE-1 retrotransposable element ORF2 protein n=1 Tax=Elysia marginata TaxID=1093978 RepID=A0AAV4J965_9GAST|nr:LINE-1 retrotransposable element ORF2 protein [Elysia marginata]
MEKDKKLERWSELFDDDRNEDLTLQGIPEGPEILREEVENTIKNMKTGKATGPVMISTEMRQALEDIKLDAITKMLNTINDTGEIPKEMLQSIFITLPKKKGVTECEQHRTISLMRHMAKVLLRIIMKRNTHVFHQLHQGNDEARKRWKKLRNYFLKSHRETTKSKSGSAGGKKKKWYLHDRMLFILPYISDRNTTSNVLPVPSDEDALDDADNMSQASASSFTAGQ